MGGPPTEGGHVHAKAAWFLKKGRTGGAAAGAATGRGLLHACNTEALSLPAIWTTKECYSYNTSL